ncbi:MAG: hypothetical protein JW829_17195 [Pirellulales bacterium]|nr:hypothetical protein [Pirellulales bacterium]
MSPETVWKALITKWPKDLPQRGVLVTVSNEQIPFRGFMFTEEMVLFERSNPDPMGSRMILLPYHQIASLRIIDVIREQVFTGMGFVGKLSGK